MRDDTSALRENSPFHSGELQAQTRTGSREAVASFARQAIRPFIPDQHRDFFQQLPFLLVGSVDRQGWPWASIVSGNPGFIQCPSPTTLEVATTPIPGDPLSEGLAKGKPLGLLGIELPTRRRNRVNVRVTDVVAGAFSVSVDQSFGNCPQYIQRRSVRFVRKPDEPAADQQLTNLQTLDDAAIALISTSDTFFVASAAIPGNRPATEGVDVSHRGGLPGFVRTGRSTLTIPDYPGNSLYNTLGNFMVNPRAGLIFADFTTGDVLQLTGTVEILWDNDPEVQALEGAERAWRFHLQRALRITNALPFRSTLEQMSPLTLLTGKARKQVWRPFVVTRVQDESSIIRSFYLKPADDGVIPTFEAGQFLTLRSAVDNSTPALVRTYTVSSAPGDPYYRISVKREPEGRMSHHLHANLRQGDLIDIREPSGDFTINPAETRPAVLLAGGVGITPMIAMARHVANQEALTRHRRCLTVMHAAQSTGVRAFAAEFRALERASGGRLRYLSFVSKPDREQRIDGDIQGIGPINTQVLRTSLALDDYDVLLCGPPAFMQATYDSLRELGVRDERIQAEAFGPASLRRNSDTQTDVAEQTEEAVDAIVHFTHSDFEHRWIKGSATLLELAESHGLTPEYGCRHGSCGSCATTLLSGEITYRTRPSVTPAANEILICCAVPARGTSTVRLPL